MRPRTLVIALSLMLAAETTLPSASASPQGLWVGQGHAVRRADLKLVEVTTEYTSEFWFVAANPTTVGPVPVNGEATVGYNLSFSDDKLRTLIGFVHWGTSFASGQIPAIAGIPGINELFSSAVSTRDLLGMRMSYREFAPVRRRQIAGSIDGSAIRIRWVAPPKPIPYQEYAVHPPADEPTKTGAHPSYPRWIGDATVSEPLPGHLVAMTSPEASSYHKGEVTISAIWSAHTVN
jgi:hypothetical protein